MSQVSVIIPCFNAAEWLPQTIESCLLQGSDFLKEVIIVDDGSEDNSREVVEILIKKHGSHIRWLRNPSKGANASRNHGLAHATGTYVQWLDADDLLLTGKFKAQIRALEDSEAAIAYSDWMHVKCNADGNEVRTLEVRSGITDYLEALLRDRWSANNSYLMTKRCADDLALAGGWNVNTKVAQDREYFTLAGIRGHVFVYEAGCFCEYIRRNPESISQMDFHKRSELTLKLTSQLIQKLRDSTALEKGRRDHYIAILQTQMLVTHYYFPDLVPPEVIAYKQIFWGDVHPKMRLVMPWIWLRAKRKNRGLPST
ncbi:MAG: glycosyltransferase family 2 protein [Flavobacteriales bacterium]|nr:glycosyltransferase family 2 protein [Flavobacteriales bacterium]